MKYFAIVGIAGALMAVGTAPSFAQYYGDYGYRHSDPHYGYYPGAQDGQCFVITDPVKEFGYWGSCATTGQALGHSSGNPRTQNLGVNPRY